jgi:hypothetical protein
MKIFLRVFAIAVCILLAGSLAFMISQAMGVRFFNPEKRTAIVSPNYGELDTTVKYYSNGKPRFRFSRDLDGNSRFTRLDSAGKITAIMILPAGKNAEEDGVVLTYDDSEKHLIDVSVHGQKYRFDSVMRANGEGSN